MFELNYDLETIYRFLNERTPSVRRIEGAAGFCLRDGAEVKAAALFYDFNGHGMWAHIALASDGSLTRPFLRAFLRYPFWVCGAEALRGQVSASNVRLRNLAKRLGAVEEAVLLGAGHGGEDLVICTLFKKELKYEPMALQ
ncbi:MAG: hypothetical protein RR566_14580 [Comamonas sp.]